MNRLRRVWARVLDWWRHRCPLCLIPIAVKLHYCARCNDVVSDLKWDRELHRNRTAEGREEA